MGPSEGVADGRRVIGTLEGVVLPVTFRYKKGYNFDLIKNICSFI